MNKRINIKFITTAFFLSIFFFSGETLRTQEEEPEKTGEPIKLIYADVLLGTESGKVKEFRGNVKFSQGDVNVNSDRAFHYLDLNVADLFGNVIITQQDLTLKAPHINYNGNTNLAVADGGVELKDKDVTLKADYGKYSTETYFANFEKHVTMWDNKSTLKADSGQYSRKTHIADFFHHVIVDDDSATTFANHVTYDRNNRNSFAYGNVYIKGKFTNVILTGDTIINFPKESYTKAYGKPVLYQIDTIKVIRYDSSVNEKTLLMNDTSKITIYKFDTLSVSCDTMEAFRNGDSSRYVFTGNVEMTKGNSYAKANKAIYYNDKEIINLTGTPVVWYDSTQLHADSIVISLPQKRLNEIRAYGQAIAGSRDDTLNPDRINQIMGDNVNVLIIQDTIRRINSYANAKSLYFSATSESDEGAARNSADSIIIDFDMGKVDTILWLGGIQGEYFPSIMFESNAQKIFLPAFRWTDNKPKKRQIPIYNH
jgi:lipopolysaccharide export system protein LptA